MGWLALLALLALLAILAILALLAWWEYFQVGGMEKIGEIEEMLFNLSNECL